MCVHITCVRIMRVYVCACMCWANRYRARVCVHVCTCEGCAYIRSLLPLVTCAYVRSLLVCNQDTNICIFFFFFVSFFSLKIFCLLFFWGVCFFIGCKTNGGKVRAARTYPGKILLRTHLYLYLYLSTSLLTNTSNCAIIYFVLSN